MQAGQGCDSNIRRALQNSNNLQYLNYYITEICMSDAPFYVFVV